MLRSAPPTSSPARRSFQRGWVLGLRWLVAVCGVIAGAVTFALGLLPAGAEWVLGGFVLWITATQWLVVRRFADNAAGESPPGRLGWLFAADVLALTVTLFFSGGAANPFSVLYLVYISLAAVGLGRRWAWLLMGLCCASYGSLFVPVPGLGAMAAGGHESHAHHGHAAHGASPRTGFDTHLAGMWWAFAMSGGLAVFFLTRLADEIRQRDRELRLAHEQRERYSRLASMMSLAASAAHELSTPLSTIAVVAKELEHELPEALRSETQLVRDEVDRCRRIVDRLSSRSGDLVGERPERLDLSTLAELVRAELPRNHAARLDLSLGEPGELELPPHAFAVAIANLVINGFEASSEQARVRLSMQVVEGVLVVEVADEGEGLDAEALPTLFDPFVTTKAERGGMGMGLYVVRALLDSLQGTLEMRPAEPRGTVAELRVAAQPQGGRT